MLKQKFKIMKQYLKLSLFLFALTFFAACNNKEVKTEKNEKTNTFTVSGEIKGLENNNLYYRFPGKDYEELGYRIDSIIVTNNKFSFKDTIKGYHLVTFFTRIDGLQKTTSSGGYYPVKSAHLNLMIHPGAAINVTGKISDFMEAYPSGDAINDDFSKIHKEVFPVINESVNYLVRSTFEKDTILIKELRKKADSVGEIAGGIKKNFVENNPASVAALYYLSDMMMRSQIKDDEAIKTFNKVDKKLNKISFYKDIEKRIQGINATKIGQIVPEIKTTSTIDNKEFDLTTYRGKYVMIDFWGTWCGPCVAEMPKVSEYAKKYKDKLEILGVNSGDSKKKMKEFLDKNNYKWQQVLNVRGESNDNFVLKFNVSGFPTKFIIDPEGKIVKKYVGNGEEAFELLDELLK